MNRSKLVCSLRAILFERDQMEERHRELSEQLDNLVHHTRQAENELARAKKIHIIYPSGPSPRLKEAWRRWEAGVPYYRSTKVVDSKGKGWVCVDPLRRWTRADEEELVRKYRRGCALDYIAASMKREWQAIVIRLFRLSYGSREHVTDAAINAWRGNFFDYSGRGRTYWPVGDPAKRELYWSGK